jgi:predicted anti-sigma-YlaC factor YlaD
LLRLAAPREVVPPERAVRLKAAVRARWRQATHGRLRRIAIGWLLGGLAVASLVSLVLSSVHVARGRDPRGQVTGETPLAIVATVEALSGSVQLVPASKIDGHVVSGR